MLSIFLKGIFHSKGCIIKTICSVKIKFFKKILEIWVLIETESKNYDNYHEYYFIMLVKPLTHSISILCNLVLKYENPNWTLNIRLLHQQWYRQMYFQSLLKSLYSNWLMEANLLFVLVFQLHLIIFRQFYDSEVAYPSKNPGQFSCCMFILQKKNNSNSKWFSLDFLFG